MRSPRLLKAIGGSVLASSPTFAAKRLTAQQDGYFDMSTRLVEDCTVGR